MTLVHPQQLFYEVMNHCVRLLISTQEGKTTEPMEMFCSEFLRERVLTVFRGIISILNGIIKLFP